MNLKKSAIIAAILAFSIPAMAEVRLREDGVPTSNICKTVFGRHVTNLFLPVNGLCAVRLDNVRVAGIVVAE